MKKLFVLGLAAFCCLVFVVSMVGCGTGGGGHTTLTAYHFVGTFEQNVCTYEAISVGLLGSGNSNVILTFEAGSVSFDITTSEAGSYLLQSGAPLSGAIYAGGYNITTEGTYAVLWAQLVTIEASGAFQSYDLGTMKMVRYLGN